MSNERGESPAPEIGAVRITDGRVEVYDGERWGPYRALPEPGGGPIFREHIAGSNLDSSVDE